MEIIVKKFESKNRPGEYLEYLYHRSDDGLEQVPLLISLHGAGSRGNDIYSMPEQILLREMKTGWQYPCTVVAPQCHCDTWFELFDVLLEFIDYYRQDSGTDANRVYICGNSMGGYAAWQVLMSRPDWFAAGLLICGGGMYWNSAKLVNVPVWAFHGALDQTVLPEESIHMVKGINDRGGHAKLTILPEAAHNAWDAAYSSPEVQEWMFAQRRAPKEEQLTCEEDYSGKAFG